MLDWGKRMIVYSIDSTNCPAHTLGNEIIIHAMCQCVP